MEAEVARKLQQLQALAAENSALKTKAEVSWLQGCLFGAWLRPPTV
jgi:hypothetical protein